MMLRSPRVKICCIANIQEALCAVQFGASAVGLVSDMPSGPGVISEERIAEIAVRIPPPVATFLLTSRSDVHEIIQQQKKCRTNTIQIVDRLTSGTHRELKEALPGISIVQVIHVTGPESLEEAVSLSPAVDALLLDSGNQNTEIKELGGTGRVHNWDISRAICKAVTVPVFLAGGLNPENIQQAIRHVNPWGIDICSGVRTNHELDRVKLKNLFLNIISSG